jgi:hypothetical protein
MADEIGHAATVRPAPHDHVARPVEQALAPGGDDHRPVGRRLEQRAVELEQRRRRITGDVAGYPLVLFIRSSSPGPTMTQVITTANTPGDYALDLDDIQAAAEFGNLLDFPSRRFYWITDLQGDDEVNARRLSCVGVA